MDVDLSLDPLTALDLRTLTELAVGSTDGTRLLRAAVREHLDRAAVSEVSSEGRLDKIAAQRDARLLGHVVQARGAQMLGETGDEALDQANMLAREALARREARLREICFDEGAATPEQVAAELATVYDPDTVLGWFGPDGSYPTDRQLARLSDEERSSLENAVSTVTDEGGLIDVVQYEYSYQKMFD